MSRRGWIAFSLAAMASVLLYLWPALEAPTVLWSDSRIDLLWARLGAGFLGPLPQASGEDAAHSVKPLYLLFLRTAAGLFPLEDARAAIVFQSLLLSISAVLTSFYLAHRRGVLTGIGLLAAMLVFLRLRNGASAVMPEALAAALLLPLGAALVAPPRRPWAFGLLGLTAGILFWVRPNAGAIALALLVTRFILSRSWRAVSLIAALFACAFLPVWIATRSQARGETGGLAFSVLEGSADYYWRPSLELSAEEIERRDERGELRAAAANWRGALAEGGPDAARQLVWRAFHGLLGTEFYDARWSPAYRALNSAATILSPFLILASIALLVTWPFAAKEFASSAVAVLLLLFLVLQNLALGSNPRYALPFFPVLFLFAVTALLGIARESPRRLFWIAVILSLLVLLVSRQKGVVGVEWGQIESSGVRLLQEIPKGALPSDGPATLHIRIAPAALPSGAHLEVLTPDGLRLYDSRQDSSRHRPEISVALPPSLLAANARGPVTLELSSSGDYGPDRYLLFPVVPRPWGVPAKRSGGAFLSPATGIVSGSLDWWAHRGHDGPRLKAP